MATTTIKLGNIRGPVGPAAGFGTTTTETNILPYYDNPSVIVNTTGPNEAKNINFTFNTPEVKSIQSIQDVTQANDNSGVHTYKITFTNTLPSGEPETFMYTLKDGEHSDFLTNNDEQIENGLTDLCFVNGELCYRTLDIQNKVINLDKYQDKIITNVINIENYHDMKKTYLLEVKTNDSHNDLIDITDGTMVEKATNYPGGKNIILGVDEYKIIVQNNNIIQAFDLSTDTLTPYPSADAIKNKQCLFACGLGAFGFDDNNNLIRYNKQSNEWDIVFTNVQTGGKWYGESYYYYYNFYRPDTGTHRGIYEYNLRTGKILTQDFPCTVHENSNEIRSILPLSFDVTYTTVIKTSQPAEQQVLEKYNIHERYHTTASLGFMVPYTLNYIYTNDEYNEGTYRFEPYLIRDAYTEQVLQINEVIQQPKYQSVFKKTEYHTPIVSPEEAQTHNLENYLIQNNTLDYTQDQLTVDISQREKIKNFYLYKDQINKSATERIKTSYVNNNNECLLRLDSNRKITHYYTTTDDYIDIPTGESVWYTDHYIFTIEGAGTSDVQYKIIDVHKYQGELNNDNTVRVPKPTGAILGFTHDDNYLYLITSIPYDTEHASLIRYDRQNIDKQSIFTIDGSVIAKDSQFTIEANQLFCVRINNTPGLTIASLSLSNINEGWKSNDISTSLPYGHYYRALITQPTFIGAISASLVDSTKSNTLLGIDPQTHETIVIQTTRQGKELSSLSTIGPGFLSEEWITPNDVHDTRTRTYRVAINLESDTYPYYSYNTEIHNKHIATIDDNLKSQSDFVINNDKLLYNTAPPEQRSYSTIFSTKTGPIYKPNGNHIALLKYYNNTIYYFSGSATENPAIHYCTLITKNNSEVTQYIPNRFIGFDEQTGICYTYNGETHEIIALTIEKDDVHILSTQQLPEQLTFYTQDAQIYNNHIYYMDDYILIDYDIISNTFTQLNPKLGGHLLIGVDDNNYYFFVIADSYTYYFSKINKNTQQETIIYNIRNTYFNEIHYSNNYIYVSAYCDGQYVLYDSYRINCTTGVKTTSEYKWVSPYNFTVLDNTIYYLDGSGLQDNLYIKNPKIITMTWEKSDHYNELATVGNSPTDTFEIVDDQLFTHINNKPFNIATLSRVNSNTTSFAVDSTTGNVFLNYEKGTAGFIPYDTMLEMEDEPILNEYIEYNESTIFAFIPDIYCDNIEIYKYTDINQKQLIYTIPWTGHNITITHNYEGTVCISDTEGYGIRYNCSDNSCEKLITPALTLPNAQQQSFVLMQKKLYYLVANSAPVNTIEIYTNNGNTWVLFDTISISELSLNGIQWIQSKTGFYYTDAVSDYGYVEKLMHYNPETKTLTNATPIDMLLGTGTWLESDTNTLLTFFNPETGNITTGTTYNWITHKSTELQFWYNSDYAPLPISVGMAGHYTCINIPLNSSNDPYEMGILNFNGTRDIRIQLLSQKDKPTKAITTNQQDLTTLEQQQVCDNLEINKKVLGTSNSAGNFIIDQGNVQCREYLQTTGLYPFGYAKTIAAPDISLPIPYFFVHKNALYCYNRTYNNTRQKRPLLKYDSISQTWTMVHEFEKEDDSAVHYSDKYKILFIANDKSTEIIQYSLDNDTEDIRSLSSSRSSSGFFGYSYGQLIYAHFTEDAGNSIEEWKYDAVDNYWYSHYPSWNLTDVSYGHDTLAIGEHYIYYIPSSSDRVIKYDPIKHNIVQEFIDSNVVSSFLGNISDAPYVLDENKNLILTTAGKILNLSNKTSTPIASNMIGNTYAVIPTYQLIINYDKNKPECVAYSYSNNVNMYNLPTSPLNKQAIKQIRNNNGFEFMNNTGNWQTIDIIQLLHNMTSEQLQEVKTILGIK